jgi:hypothetical protein
MATNRIATLTAEARAHLLGQALAKINLTPEELVDLLAAELYPALERRVDERMDKLESGQIELSESVVKSIQSAQARAGLR